MTGRGLAIAWACALCAAAGAVEIARQEDGWLVRAAGYQALVAEDGALTSLQVRGAGGPVEFLASRPGAPRGLYPYLKGPLPLPQIEQPEPTVITARAASAAVRYSFAEDAITVTVDNPGAEQLSLLGIFLPEVKVISDEFDVYYPLPMKGSWGRVVWYRDDVKLAVEGRASVWGPWSDGFAVWQLKVEAGHSATVTLRPGQQSEQEAAQVKQVLAGERQPPTDPEGPMWKLEQFSRPPQTWPAPGWEQEGVRAIFYEGMPFRGRPTRVFAYVGVPEVTPGEKVPGMVLVHGGGGTAFAEWVRLWQARGYAAIAMDTCGHLPEGARADRPRHEFSGPPGWGGWEQIDWPREDQWTWHAVADALLAHSLLRSLREVDPERIGVTGISWGGYLTSIIAGVDPRLKLAMPVYGCGYYLDTHFVSNVRGLGEERAARWMRWWDPSNYLKDAHLPMLWVTGTNDFAYWLPALQKSYRTAPGPHTLCVTLRMPHGHSAGWAPEELYAFADSILRGGVPLPRITGQGRDGATVWVSFASQTAITRAELLYTCGRQPQWPEREWQAEPAQVQGTRATATLPAGATVWFINLTDERGLTVSSEHEELGRPEDGHDNGGTGADAGRR